MNIKRTLSYIDPYECLVCFMWGTGLVLGWYITERIPYELLSLMRMFRVEHVSIVSVLSVQLLPFFISVLLFRHASAYMVLPVVLLEGIQLGYCGCLFSLLFGNASWLVIAVVLFFSIFSAPLLLWFWLRRPSGKGSGDRMIVSGTAFALAMLGVLDFFVVSPFWEALLY